MSFKLLFIIVFQLSCDPKINQIHRLKQLDLNFNANYTDIVYLLLFSPPVIVMKK